MARKATVDRNLVLQFFKRRQNFAEYCHPIGVSRQAIDLYRKEFFRTGILQNVVTPYRQPHPTPAFDS